MEYRELQVQIKAGTDAGLAEEMIVSGLADLGFESFTMAEDGKLSAFTQAGNEPSEDQLPDVLNSWSDSYTWVTHAHRNWNEEWEKSFEPVTLGNRVYVYADFHEKVPGYAHYIRITPKMSFGTGHHSTTRLVMDLMFETKLTGKEILDIGTGTGILAILAYQLGATRIAATEIEPWALENARENFESNGLTEYELFDAAEKSGGYGIYDLTIANINRNIILHMQDELAGSVKGGGGLILSGFYDRDVPMLAEAFQRHGFSLQAQRTENDWCAMYLTKNE